MSQKPWWGTSILALECHWPICWHTACKVRELWWSLQEHLYEPNTTSGWIGGFRFCEEGTKQRCGLKQLEVRTMSRQLSPRSALLYPLLYFLYSWYSIQYSFIFVMAMFWQHLLKHHLSDFVYHSWFWLVMVELWYKLNFTKSFTVFSYFNNFF